MIRARHSTTEDEFRFGRTVITVDDRSPFDLGVDAIVCPANSRGVMGVGTAGLVRIHGGQEIEREAMSHAPMTPGTAIVTSAGQLEAAGTRRIIHAVIANSLGSPTREQTIRQATVAALEAADHERVRSIAIPVLRSGQSLTMLSGERAFSVMIEEIVAHLRRYTSRLDRIVLLTHDQRESDTVSELLANAQELWWGMRV